MPTSTPILDWCENAERSADAAYSLMHAHSEHYESHVIWHHTGPIENAKKIEIQVLSAYLRPGEHVERGYDGRPLLGRAVVTGAACEGLARKIAADQRAEIAAKAAIDKAAQDSIEKKVLAAIAEIPALRGKKLNIRADQSGTHIQLRDANGGRLLHTIH